MNSNTFVWMALLGLTVFSFSISNHAFGSLILATAGLKAAMVAWSFMELRRAHQVWKLGVGALIALALGLVYVIWALPT